MTRAVITAFLLAAATAPITAQTPRQLAAPKSGAQEAREGGPGLRKHRFAISGGLTWLGGYGVGSRTAVLRRNEIGTSSPSALTLFRADASVEPAGGFEARIGYAVTRELAVELGGAYGRPIVAVEIADDVEAGPQRLAGQRLSQYVVAASVVLQISRLELGRRARPYVIGGGGYLRQLDVDRVKAETGKTFHAGGGVRYWLRGGDSAHRALGVRGEVRLQLRTGGVDFAGQTRAFPVATVFGFFGF